MGQENAGKRFEGYQIYDRHYEKVGKVDDLFVDENDSPEYVGFKTGLFGGPSVLIPMDVVRVNDARGLVEVAADADTIKNAPSFGDDSEITPDFEDRVYAHFGATREAPPSDRGGYGAYHDEDSDVDLAYGERSQASATGAASVPPEYEHPTGGREAAYSSGSAGEGQGHAEARPGAEPQGGARVYDWDIDIGAGRRETGSGGTGYEGEGSRESVRGGSVRGGSVREDAGAGTTGATSAGSVGAGMSQGDTESSEFREHDRDREAVSQPGSDLADEDELRVQRSEEELRAGTREREAGNVNVRKRVRIDRERLSVPTRREEVTVERVPVSGGATEAQIGDDEVSVPVVEDEVVVQKRAVAKEEIRVRKDVVHEQQIVEEDVRREEVEVEDDTARRGR